MTWFIGVNNYNIIVHGGARIWQEDLIVYDGHYPIGVPDLNNRLH